MNKGAKTNRENGFMSIEWLLGIALLIIPVFILTVNILQYPPKKSLSQVAASEAVKAFVQEDNIADARIAADDAARTIIKTELGLSDTEYDAMNSKNTVVEYSKFNSANYCSGQNVTLIVSLPMPVIWNPFSDSKDSLTSLDPIKSSATERIDDYNDLEEDASCPDT